MRAYSVSSRSSGTERAQLVRLFNETLYCDKSDTEVWAKCGTIIADLMEASSVTIATRDGERDQIVSRIDLIHPAAEAASSKQNETGSHGGDVATGSFIAEVLSSNDTIVRVNVAGEYSIGVPMRVGRNLLGAISVEFCQSNDPALIMLLESCALSAAARINANVMLQSTERYERLALTDSLTGISNRRRFDEALDIEWRRAIRSGTSVCMLMMDVDFFKVYNDTYGHPAGDACLRAVAGALSESFQRPADMCARYGGEEFVALLPDVGIEGGTLLAERIRSNVARLGIPHSGSSLERVSLSIGVASIVPAVAGGEASSLIQAADDALYRAKHGGRNRVYAENYCPDTVDPPVMRRVAAANNLPKPLTRLVGRLHEISEIEALLRAGERLVTLAACGGAGKTRTSIAVAANMVKEYPDGAWFVDLSRLVDAALIAPTIGSLFGLEIPANSPHALATLVRALATKKSLIVLDNCEHMVAASADIVAQILAGCDDIQVIATTREPLGIGGECLYRLPLLSLPPSNKPITAAEAITYDAVALFVDRAKVAKRDFTMTDDNANTIVNICHELDGIALAIELAAARVSVINPAEIARRLSERMALLRGGDRNAQPRQQTMRALIDWSYDLLSVEEQLIFRRLSIFVGGWTFEAMLDVCAGADLKDADIFELLAGLVRKSLVIESDHGDVSRYRLLESVREYASEKLLDDDGRAELAHRHASYYLRLSNAARATHFSTASRKWFMALEPELENCRAALHWSLIEGGDVLLGAALAGSLVNFLTQVSPSETLRWTSKALELLPPGSDPKIEGGLWYGIGRSREKLPADRLREAAERTVDLYRLVGDSGLLCEALRHLVLFITWYFPDERDRARELSLELIELARETRDPIQLALALRSRSVTIDNSDVEAKQAVLEESLKLLMRHGNDLQTAIAFMWLAEFDFCFGSGAKASTYAREAMRFAEESGSTSMVAQMNANLAQYSAADGNWQLTVDSAREAARLSSALGMDDHVTWSIQALAMVRAGLGDYPSAARLLGFCDSRIGKLHSERQADCAEEILYRRLITTLRENMNEAVLHATMLVGESMTEEEALKLGLTSLSLMHAAAS